MLYCAIHNHHRHNHQKYACGSKHEKFLMIKHTEIRRMPTTKGEATTHHYERCAQCADHERRLGTCRRIVALLQTKVRFDKGISEDAGDLLQTFPKDPSAFDATHAKPTFFSTNYHAWPRQRERKKRQPNLTPPQQQATPWDDGLRAQHNYCSAEVRKSRRRRWFLPQDQSSARLTASE